MSTAPNLTLDEIEDEALRLPAESRAELVESLLASFGGPDPDVQREWLDEAERRRGAGRGGPGRGGVRQGSSQSPVTRVILHPAAQAELVEAASRYDGQVRGLGERFLQRVEDATSAGPATGGAAWLTAEPGSQRQRWDDVSEEPAAPRSCRRTVQQPSHGR
jgi:hypothetical protein